MSADVEYAPIDALTPQFTLRAVATGMLLGGLLSLCNVYLGLKIGWGMNMSVTAALLGFGLWKVTTTALNLRPLNLLENNINQTTASSAAAISSSGLVTAVPALTMITGETLTYPMLVLWTAAVSWVGVISAIAVRRQMLVVDKLRFPGGVATGQTLKEIYAHGDEAMARVRMLLASMAVGAVSKVATLALALKPIGIPGALPIASGGVVAKQGYWMVSLKNLGFALDPSLMMVAVGGIVGLRATVSMMLGAICAWLLLGPWILENGWVTPPPVGKGVNAVWFGSMVTWTLWPGAAMMVVASLTAVSFSWREALAAFRGGAAPDPDAEHDVQPWAFRGALVVVTAISVAAQVFLFGIPAWVALLSVGLSFVLAVVAARVSGETGVTPVGAMGKVTQLTLGVVDPGSATSNLMAANVTGGAASQCGDLLNDMKSGMMLGSVPRYQAMAQAFGVTAGAVIGSAVYMILIPDPKRQLLTEEWQAPSVAQWKAVAEVFQKGLEAMPTGTPAAIGVACVLGVLLTFAERLLPSRLAVWVPSPVAFGLAFSIAAYTSISFLIGGILMAVSQWAAPAFTRRFGIVIAAGIIAGESLAGVGDALWKILQSVGG